MANRRLAKNENRLLPLLALFLLQSSCYLQCGGPAIGSGHTAGHAPMAILGPETWMISGHPYGVQATYYLALPEGMQYTVDYLLTAGQQLPHQNDAALAVSFPLMRHAFESGLYKRSTISKLGTGGVAPSRIGVAIYQAEGLHKRGYAISLSLGEIQQRIGSLTANPAITPARR